MNYIMKHKPVHSCLCGAVCQPKRAEIVDREEYDVEKLTTVTYQCIYCPNCGQPIRIKLYEGVK